MQHLKYALRVLRRHPGFSAPAIAALALGIGAATAMFSVVDCVLLRPLPYPESERLISLGVKFPDGAELLPSTQFLNWTRDTRTLESAAAQGAGGEASLIGPDGATAITEQKVTIGFLATLRVRPAAGRDFLPSDGAAGAPNVAIVSHVLSEQHPVGSAINIDGTLYTVIGALPRDFRYMPSLAPLDVLLPLQIAPSFYTDLAQMRAWRVIARLKEGVSIEQARAEFGPLLAAAKRDPRRQMPRLYAGAELHVIPYREFITGGVRRALLLLLVGVGCVLLISCGNVVNLLLTRGEARRREFAIRAAIGASRERLIRDLLGESLVLALAGGALGTALCFVAIPVIRSAMSQRMPRIAELTVDLRVLSFALALSIATSIVFGLLPAIHASRRDVDEGLKRSRFGVSKWLVAAELALSLMLLSGAGLLLQSLWRMQHRSMGFDPDRLIVADISLRGTRLQSLPPLDNLPGVVSTAAADGVPPHGGCCGVTLIRTGRPAPPSRGELTLLRHVTPAYFSTLRIALKRGRLLDDRDHDQESGAVAVNEALVRRYFPGEDPVGQGLFNGNNARVIVGVVADAKNDGLATQAIPEVISPFERGSGTAQIAIRTLGDPFSLERAVQQLLRRANPLVRVRLRTMDEEFHEMTAQPRFMGGLFTAFALTALLLAVVGIYGVVAFAVSRRTRELGIRLALGANGKKIVRLVLWDAVAPIAAGILMGIAGSFAGARYLSSILYGVRASDPLTFAIVAIALAVLAFTASAIPARRAGRVDPGVVLRAE